MLTNYQVLIIEDDLSMVRSLSDLLETSHYHVRSAHSGQEAIALLNTYTPHLILSDLRLPDVYGLELLEFIKHKYQKIPYLIMSSQTDEIDVVLGLEQGAEDYIYKPFKSRELLTRIRKILQRHYTAEVAQSNPKHVLLGELILYPEQREAHFKSERIDLSMREFDLLYYLANHRNRVCTRQQILDELWPNEYDIIDRIVDTHISHLRLKLKQVGCASDFIQTLRGIGYILKI